MMGFWKKCLYSKQNFHFFLGENGPYILCYIGTAPERWETHSNGSCAPESFGTVWERSIFSGSCNGNSGKFWELWRLFFLEFRRSLGLGNTKLVEKYAELLTKHEPMLKPSQEERPKTSLTLIFLIERLEQYLDGLRKCVALWCKGDIWDVILMSISFCLCIYIAEDCVWILYVEINA